MRAPGLLLILFLLAPTVFAAALLDEGEIDGARFTIARPAKWNGSLLLLAHGLRAENIPLVADLNPDHPANRKLLDEGWMIAMTSYRRNGIIVADAVDDLDHLRAHIAKRYGEPRQTILEGDSMGGLIVTLIAERTPDEPPRYHGALAIGAALSIREEGSRLGISFETHIPLLFLSNKSELDGPASYSRARLTQGKGHPGTAARNATVPATVFRVGRDGHVNVNQAERLFALRALIAWLESGRESLPAPEPGREFVDATIAPAPAPSHVVFDDQRQSFTTRVTGISGDHGNIAIDAQAADFAALGIRANDWFQISSGDRSRRVLYGTGFASVKRGDWVAFPHADGITWLARNFENAATTAAISIDDEILIRRYTGAPAPDSATSP